MDPKTLAHYTENATEIARRYESVVSPVERYFALAFTHGARVLDVGCGSGRDAARLLNSGYDAYGIEPVEALRHAAMAAHPELAGRISEGALPRTGGAFGGEFDGIRVLLRCWPKEPRKPNAGAGFQRFWVLPLHIFDPISSICEGVLSQKPARPAASEWARQRHGGGLTLDEYPYAPYNCTYTRHVAVFREIFHGESRTT